MAEVRSFCVPVRSVTPAEEKALRDVLAARMVQEALNAALATHADSLTIRDALPFTDFPTSYANQDWLSAALVVNTEMTLVNQILPNNKFVGFYGISMPDANPALTALYFRVGATGASTYLSILVQNLLAELQAVGVFSRPVIYKPTDNIFIRAHPVIAKAAGERIVLRALVCEPLGANVSRASIEA